MIDRIKSMSHMELCVYDKRNLKYRHFNVMHTAFALLLVGALALLSFKYALDDVAPSVTEEMQYEKVPIIINQDLEFSQDALWVLINDLGIRHPHIVMAQSVIETGGYTSNIFEQNNNLFGMKCAASRCTTHKGQANGHAWYDTWQSSVIDYAFYQTSYIRDARTDDQYYEALGKSYAEDPSYVDKLKPVAEELKKKYPI